jgi:hypothetical protein
VCRGCRTLVSGHHDISMLLEAFGEQVSDGVVLLLEYEVGSVGHALATVSPSLDIILHHTAEQLTWDNLLHELFLALGEQEALEPGTTSAKARTTPKMPRARKIATVAGRYDESYCILPYRNRRY